MIFVRNLKSVCFNLYGYKYFVKLTDKLKKIVFTTKLILS